MYKNAFGFKWLMCHKTKPNQTKPNHTISLNPDQKTRTSFTKQKTKTYHKVDFAVLADHQVKMKESEKKKYWDLARGQKLWNMKVTVIPHVVGTTGTVLKNLERILGNWWKWRVTEESEPFRLQLHQNRLEKTRKPGETCCLSESSKNHLLELLRKNR